MHTLVVVLPSAFGIVVLCIAIYAWQCCPRSQMSELRKAYDKVTGSTGSVFNKVEKSAIVALGIGVLPYLGCRRL